MRCLKFMLVLVLAISMTSCLDLSEEIKLNRDGSGTYALTFDMGAMFSDNMMKGMFKEMLGESEEAGAIFGEGMETDTVMYFRDMPQARSGNLERMDIWNNTRMEMKVSETTGQFQSKLVLDFRKIEDVDYFLQNLDKIAAEGEEAGMMNPGSGLFPEGIDLVMSGKKLTRGPLQTESMADEDAETMEMMKMFLGSGTYTTIYELPGKVRKTTISGATVNGNRVVVETPLTQMMEGKAVIDGMIKFK